MTSETRALAEYVAGSDLDAVPHDVRREARRALLNYVGCALGGSVEPAVDVAVRVLAPYSGPPRSAVLGRRERFDPLHAALLNGIASHVHEFDDTTPKNYIHPSPPVASALFAHAAAHRVSGADFVHAFILGFEAESRVGDAVYPAHYEAGWHITATAGVFGAAAAIGRLLQLSAEQMVFAFGLAATQAAGIREMFGSMAKSFQPGRAAQNGYTAALLAAASFTAGERAIEGPRGFAAVAAARHDLTRITDGLGTRFSLRENAYKPYACGIVVHPIIDGCSRLRERHRLDPARVRAVRLEVAPLVLDLCNHKTLHRALQSKYSIYHAAAIGLARGKGGLEEFTDEAVADPMLARLRARTTAVPNPRIGEDQVRIEVELDDGDVLELFVEESLGNLRRPLTDAQLEEKFRDLAARALPAGRIDAVIERCRRIEELDDVGELVRAAVP
ncbi:MAG TPA: MmgE/PrpD family protein [Gammaproteobacteria bacterium]